MARRERTYPRFDMRLPECGARHDVRPEQGVFFCGHPGILSKHSIVFAGYCRSCPFLGQPLPEKLRPFRMPPPYEYVGPCQHLGEFKELRDCPTCSGHVRRKVFQCNHERHEETTIQDCQDCYDYLPPAEGALPIAT